MSGTNWRELADAFSKVITDKYLVVLKSRTLSRKLIEYTFDPSNPSAAPLSLIVSPFEVIVIFGANGNRIELSSLPSSETRLVKIVNAIAKGKLVESKRKWLAKYRLELSDGTVLRGGSVSGIPIGRSVRTYKPW